MQPTPACLTRITGIREDNMQKNRMSGDAIVCAAVLILILAYFVFALWRLV
jgi:hypothetical protein